MLSIISFT